MASDPAVPVARRVALRKESVDRNYKGANMARSQWVSLSARRAWIEIPKALPLPRWHLVALRKESVDRNLFPALLLMAHPVALRKESVDRNTHSTQTIKSNIIVALRKESVDRNIKEDVSYSIIIKSLSARRAWIEIS